MKTLRKEIFFKLVVVLLVAFFTVSCGDSGSSPAKVSNVPTTYDDNTGEEDEPIIEDPISEVNMKAVFLYDGSLKSFNDDKSLSVVCDADTVVKLSDGRWIINDELKKTLTGTAEKIFPGNVKKACIYNNTVFAYTKENKIYKVTDSGVELFAENNSGSAVALNDDGIAIGFTFYNPDGSKEVACTDFAFWLANKIVRVDTVGSYKKKSVKKDGVWTQISSGLYTNFIKFDALVTDKKVIWPAGTTLDLETMTAVEPQFQSSTQTYISGNAFVKHFIRYTEQRWQPIGYIGDLAYFFYPKTGKVFKYAISADVLTEWVKITDATDSDDITTNNNMITKTGCILVDNEIIYFDGLKINRINVDTGEKVEIAEATEFYGVVI